VHTLVGASRCPVSGLVRVNEPVLFCSLMPRPAGPLRGRGGAGDPGSGGDPAARWARPDSSVSTEHSRRRGRGADLPDHSPSTPGPRPRGRGRGSQGEAPGTQGAAGAGPPRGPGNPRRPLAPPRGGCPRGVRDDDVGGALAGGDRGATRPLGSLLSSGATAAQPVPRPGPGPPDRPPGRAAVPAGRGRPTRSGSARVEGPGARKAASCRRPARPAAPPRP